MAKKTTDQSPMDECFVMMPISDTDGYEKGHFNHVYENIIVPACEQSNLVPRIASDVKQTNLIHLDIIKKIVEAPMAICDLSSKNPNVMFELGIRQAFDKPVVLMKERGQSAIFDIAPLRYVEYSKSMKYHEVIAEQSELQQALEETFAAVNDPGSVNSIVRLMSLQSASLPALEGTDAHQAGINYLVNAVNEMQRDLRKIGNVPSNDSLLSNTSRLNMARISKDLNEAKHALLDYEEFNKITPTTELQKMSKNLYRVLNSQLINESSSDFSADIHRTYIALSEMIAGNPPTGEADDH